MTVATCNSESPLETEVASEILRAYMKEKRALGRKGGSTKRETDGRHRDARFLAGHTFANLVALLVPDETTDC